MKKILAALFLALIALAPIPAALADGNPTTILAGCGMAVNGLPSSSLYSFGTLSTYLTVTKTTGSTASYSCGGAVVRSNGGTAMADPTPAPSAGLIYYVVNGDASAGLTLTAPSGVIFAGSTSATTLVLAAGQTALIAADGTNQYVIGGNYGGGQVASFNGRKGAVVPAAGDYSIAQITGSGTGIVISTSGTLSVATSLQLSQLASQSANVVVGTTAAGALAALAVPSCSGANQALTWTTGTGFGCATISGGGSGCATTGCTYTGPVLLTGTSFATPSAGQLTINGIMPVSGLGASGEGAIYLNSSNGLVLEGDGATNDIEILNSSVGAILTVLHGTQNPNFFGRVTINNGGGLALSSGTSAGFSGFEWYDSTQNTLSVNENGLNTYKSGTIYAAEAAVTTSGTSNVSLLSTTAAGTATLPTNYLVAGKTIRISLSGYVTTAATPGTLSMNVQLGTSSVGSQNAVTLTSSVTNAPFGMTLLITCMSAGTSGSVAVSTLSYFSPAGGNTVGNILSIGGGAALTVNTTGSLAINVTSLNSVSGGTVLKITNAVIEELM
jgi:hypothetical protein